MHNFNWNTKELYNVQWKIHDANILCGKLFIIQLSNDYEFGFTLFKNSKLQNWFVVGGKYVLFDNNNLT